MAVFTLDFLIYDVLGISDLLKGNQTKTNLHVYVKLSISCQLDDFYDVAYISFNWLEYNEKNRWLLSRVA